MPGPADSVCFPEQIPPLGDDGTLFPGHSPQLMQLPPWRALPFPLCLPQARFSFGATRLSGTWAAAPAALTEAASEGPSTRP